MYKCKHDYIVNDYKTNDNDAGFRMEWSCSVCGDVEGWEEGRLYEAKIVGGIEKCLDGREHVFSNDETDTEYEKGKSAQYYDKCTKCGSIRIRRYNTKFIRQCREIHSDMVKASLKL